MSVPKRRTSILKKRSNPLGSPQMTRNKKRFSLNKGVRFGDEEVSRPMDKENADPQQLAQSMAKPEINMVVKPKLKIRARHSLGGDLLRKDTMKANKKRKFNKRVSFGVIDTRVFSSQINANTVDLDAVALDTNASKSVGFGGNFAVEVIPDTPITDATDIQMDELQFPEDVSPSPVAQPSVDASDLENIDALLDAPVTEAEPVKEDTQEVPVSPWKHAAVAVEVTQDLTQDVDQSMNQSVSMEFTSNYSEVKNAMEQLSAEQEHVADFFAGNESVADESSYAADNTEDMSMELTKNHSQLAGHLKKLNPPSPWMQSTNPFAGLQSATEDYTARSATEATNIEQTDVESSMEMTRNYSVSKMAPPSPWMQSGNMFAGLAVSDTETSMELTKNHSAAITQLHEELAQEEQKEAEEAEVVEASVSESVVVEASESVVEPEAEPEEAHEIGLFPHGKEKQDSVEDIVVEEATDMYKEKQDAMETSVFPGAEKEKQDALENVVEASPVAADDSVDMSITGADFTAEQSVDMSFTKNFSAVSVPVEQKIEQDTFVAPVEAEMSADDVSMDMSFTKNFSEVKAALAQATTLDVEMEQAESDEPQPQEAEVAQDDPMDIDEEPEDTPQEKSVFETHEEEASMEFTKNVSKVVSDFLHPNTPATSNIDMAPTTPAAVEGMNVTAATPTGATGEFTKAVARNFNDILMGGGGDKTEDLPKHGQMSELTEEMADIFEKILAGDEVTSEQLAAATRRTLAEAGEADLTSGETNVTAESKFGNSFNTFGMSPISNGEEASLNFSRSNETGSLKKVKPMRRRRSSIGFLPPVETLNESVNDVDMVTAEFKHADGTPMEMTTPARFTGAQKSDFCFQDFLKITGARGALESAKKAARDSEIGFEPMMEDHTRNWPPYGDVEVLNFACVEMIEADLMNQMCLYLVDNNAEIQTCVSQSESYVDYNPPAIFAQLSNTSTPMSIKHDIQKKVVTLLKASRLESILNWTEWRVGTLQSTMDQFRHQVAALKNDEATVAAMTERMQQLKELHISRQTPDVSVLRDNVRNLVQNIEQASMQKLSLEQNIAEAQEQLRSAETDEAAANDELEQLHIESADRLGEREAFQSQIDIYTVMENCVGWKPIVLSNEQVVFRFHDSVDLRMPCENGAAIPAAATWSLASKVQPHHNPRLQKAMSESLLAAMQPALNNVTSQFTELSHVLRETEVVLGRMEDLQREIMALSSDYVMQFTTHNNVPTLVVSIVRHDIFAEKQVILRLQLNSSYPFCSLLNPTLLDSVVIHHAMQSSDKILTVDEVKAVVQSVKGYGKLSKACKAVKNLLY